MVPLPETRDYKRAFNGDRGPNTGGMGSYKNIGDTLPFMTRADREKEIEIITKIFERWKNIECNALRGMPFYVAFMHTKDGLKILENNSRPGDPEIINILPILKQDFIDICFKMLEGNLTHVELEKVATVVTYKVPPNYSQYMNVFPELVQENEIGNPIDLAKAYRLSRKSNGNILIYPASMELRNNETYALESRTVASVGIGATVQEAREMSTKGLKAIQGGSLWYRADIASKQHIGRSVKHMEELRRHKY